MRFTKATKRVLSLSMAAAVAATTVAVPVVSQKADAAERIPANTGSCGHGCGHQLI